MELKCFEVIMPYRDLKKYHKKYDIENIDISSKELVNKLCESLKIIFNTDKVYGGDFPSLGDYCYPAFIFNIEYKSGMENISLKDTGFYFVPVGCSAIDIMENLYDNNTSR